MRFLYVCLLALMCSACSSDELPSLEIGEDFTQIDTRVIFMDTMTVRTSTFRFDSLEVSSSQRLMVGALNHPTLGSTITASYMQLLRSFADEGSDYYDLDDDAVYDSIALIMVYDRYSYGDTLPMQTYSVHKILQDIEPDEDTDLFYNTSQFNYDPNPIALETLTVNPLKEDSLTIKLDDAFGTELFEKILQNDITNNDELLDEYKGLVLQSDPNNTSILGFDMSGVLRLYYTIDGETGPLELEFDFLINSDFSFSHINNAYTGTPFGNLDEQDEMLSSTDTDNTTYVQAGKGLTTRIDIPYTHSLYDIPGDGVLVDAFLRLPIERPVEALNLPVRDSIRAFLINDKSEVLGSLLGFGATDAYGSFSDETDEFSNLAYVFNLKPFIDLKLTESDFSETFYLAINPQDFNQSLDQYIFYNDPESEDRKITLELTYAVYDEED